MFTWTYNLDLGVLLHCCPCWLGLIFHDLRFLLSLKIVSNIRLRFCLLETCAWTSTRWNSTKMKLSGLPLNRSHTPTPCLTKDTAQSTEAVAGQWGQEMWKVPPDGPYWERFDRLGLSNDPLRPYFLPNDLLGRRGFNLREYFSLDNDPSGKVTPHTISNATEKLRTLSATSNPLHCTTCSGSFENHDRRPPWRFALRGGILLSCHC